MFRTVSEMMRPLILKFGVAFALTVVGYLFSHLRSKRVLPSLPPPQGGKAGGDPGLKEIQCSGPPEKEESTEEAFEPAIVGLSSSSGAEENVLLPEFNDLVQIDFKPTCISPTTPGVDAYAQKSKTVSDPIEQEVINLRSVAKVIGERERNLEIQLLKYYGLKESESAVRELENRLKINTMEAKFFALKIDSLQAENKRLEAQVSEHAKVVAELELAKGKIKLLKRKIRTDGEQNRDQLCLLQQRVAALQEEENKVEKLDPDALKKIQMFENLEDELMELKNEISNLQRENSELATKLDSTQIVASLVSEDPEVKCMEEEVRRLQEANSKLEKEIERLQTDRCSDVEELVYLRWINACLRYELRNYQPPPGKTAAKDLSKEMSPKSEQKAKQLILEYANSGIRDNSFRLINFDTEYGSSSRVSTPTEAGEFDDLFCDNSNPNRSSSSHKSKLFSKLKRLVSGKDLHFHHHHHRPQHSSVGSTRRVSMDTTDSSSGVSERPTSNSNTSSGEFTENCRLRSIVSSSEDRRSRSKSFNNLKAMGKGEEGKAGEDRRKNIQRSSISTVRSYTDIDRLRELIPEETKGIRDSDGLKSEMILTEGGSMELVEDYRTKHTVDDTPEKLELKKFAQVLKSSRAGLNLPKRRSSFAY